MKNWNWLLFSAMPVLMVCGSSARAEKVERWSFERLFKESDYVLIATFESTTEKDELLKNPLGEQKLRLVLSRLTIVESVKGDLKKGDGFEVVHWRLEKDARQQMLPTPIIWEKNKSFDIGPSGYHVPVAYFVFLRKTGKGSLELTTGILNGVESVRAILPHTNNQHRN